MTDYENNIFNGKCPYTDMPCADKIPCVRCRMNEEERVLMEKMEEMEMLQEELERCRE